MSWKQEGSVPDPGWHSTQICVCLQRKGLLLSPVFSLLYLSSSHGLKWWNILHVHVPAEHSLPTWDPQPPFVTHSHGRPQCFCILAQKRKALLSSSPPSLPRTRFSGIMETQSSRPVEQHQQRGQARWGTTGLAVNPSSVEVAVWQDCCRSVVTPSSF